MIISNNERGHLIAALIVAIESQEKYERGHLRYTSDSAQLATWRSMLKELKDER